MSTKREGMFGELPDGTFLYCINCERAYMNGRHRIKVMYGKEWPLEIRGDTMEMCPYEGCDGDAVIDAWEWDRIRSEHSDYPEIPEEGKVYPMYS